MNENIVFIEGIGYCREVVVNRLNNSGISEPYCYYELID